ncbi:MAG: hypothetical protein HC806_06740, partial [Anaerolineae bacterium]|nr:hypothetical protein [Anaerolineae bacterium]
QPFALNDVTPEGKALQVRQLGKVLQRVVRKAHSVQGQVVELRDTAQSLELLASQRNASHGRIHRMGSRCHSLQTFQADASRLTPLDRMDDTDPSGNLADESNHNNWLLLLIVAT